MYLRRYIILQAKEVLYTVETDCVVTYTAAIFARRTVAPVRGTPSTATPVAIAAIPACLAVAVAVDVAGLAVAAVQIESGAIALAYPYNWMKGHCCNIQINSNQDMHVQ